MGGKKPRSRIDAWLHEPTLEDRRLAYRTRRLRGSRKYAAVGAGGVLLGVVMNKSDVEEDAVSGTGNTVVLVRKADDDTRRRAGAAVTAGGGMGVVLGTVASGVPGFRAKPGDSALKRAPAGILGGRYASHTDVTNQYRTKAGGKQKTLVGRFKASRNAGKVHAEKKVLEELKSGYRLGRKGQAAGAAVLGGGLLLSRAGGDRRGRDGGEGGGNGSAALAGGGAATAGGAYGVSSALRRKSGEWADRGVRSAKRAESLVAGSTRGGKDALNERGLRRASGPRRGRKAVVEAAGHAAGDARQSKYLSYAYGANAKAFRAVGHGAAGAALLGAGLSAKRMADERRSRGGKALRRERR